MNWRNYIKVNFKPLTDLEIDLIWQQISRRELITQMYLQHQQWFSRVDA